MQCIKRALISYSDSGVFPQSDQGLTEESLGNVEYKTNRKCPDEIARIWRLIKPN